MIRLAWFTPLPPVRSGIAAYNAELLPLLADAYDIDVYVETPSNAQRPTPRLRASRSGEARRSSLPALTERTEPASAQVRDAHDFVWRHHTAPYDLVVYQLGNQSCHDYMWAYLARYPGLVVLHDGVLHHSRAAALLGRKRHEDYRAELAWNHPGAPAGVSELGIAGLLGSMTYLWPWNRLVVRASRAVAVHNRWLAETLAEDSPEARIDVIRMGVADPLAGGLGEDVRARHGLPPDAVVFTAFGGVTPEKRLPQVLAALAAVAPEIPKAHLLLLGAEAPYYDVRADAEARGVSERLTLAGYVPDAALPAYLAATDVCLCLRWPSARESSASWLRCLAAGKPTIVTDLVHTADVPSLYTRRTWTPSHPVLGPAPDADDRAPICVSIDILDEDQALQVAMRRLAQDAAMRRTLGRRARRYWERRHMLAAMVEDYRRVIAAALERPAPRPAPDLPPHFRADGLAPARALAASVGSVPDILPPDR